LSAQTPQSIHNITSGGDDKPSSSAFLLEQISTFSISGLGSTQLTDDPSANINAQINVNPSKNKICNILLNFNKGSSKDTTDLSSVSLTRIFFPDNSSFGFSGGIDLDLLALLQNHKYPKLHTIGNVILSETGNDYNYYSLNAQLQYSYRKISLKNLEDTTVLPRIETQSLFFALNLAAHWKIGDNRFDISLAPYIKSQWITQATDSTYQYIFKDSNGGEYLSKNIVSKGVNLSAQLGKVQLSFLYDYVNPKVVKDRALTGGTFIIKSTVAADFLRFNFKPKT